MSTATRWLIAAAFSFIFCCAYLLDGQPTELQAAAATAADLQDAIHTAQLKDQP